MRIGMLSWESLYSIKVGGVAPHVSELSEALSSIGHEVHVFTRRGGFNSYDRINGVHYQRVDSDSSGDIVKQMDNMSNAMYDRFDAVQKLFGPFDIIHGHDWHPIVALNRIKRDHGIPYTLTIHSTEWGRNGNSFGDGVFKEISHREWLGGYESARVIVTTSRMLDELVQIYSIPKSKISIIPNGIKAGKFKRSSDAIKVKEKYGIYPGEPMVLFCGRMSIQKGPDLLVEAIPKILTSHGNVKFVFIGEGCMRHICERRAYELGVSGACRFLGYLPASEKEELMEACDIFCIPSRNEPFGVVVLEAWDACKPVVATEAVSIIRNFEDGLMAYIQPESLAWCINRLLCNPDEMKKLAQAGCSRIEKEFRWDMIAKKTEELYNKMISNTSDIETAGQPSSFELFKRSASDLNSVRVVP